MSRRREIRKAPHDMKVGFAGDSKTIRVDVAEGDLPPWDLDSKLSIVGTDVPRIDAVAKVTGRARFAFDVRLPGMLEGAILRAKIPSGNLTAIDVSAAETMPGVHAVVMLKEPGRRGTIRFVGDAIAAVAAETRDQALDALEAIVVTVEKQPAITDPLRAEGAPTMADGEVTDAWPEADGEKVNAALDKAAHKTTGTWTCEVQTHTALESHGHVCAFDEAEGTLSVWASTQATFGTRAGLASALGIGADKVRVHSEFVGGGFGAKFSPGAEGMACALLSRASKRPVKLMLDRFEEHTCAGNRPGAIVQIRAGIDADGKLCAWDYRSWGTPGFPALEREQAGGSTRFPGHYLRGVEARQAHRDLGMHTDAGRAMRAPGHPQGYFAAEGMLDELARRHGMDPLAFRLANDPEVPRRAEWQLGAKEFGWAERWRPWGERDVSQRKLRGAGLASTAWRQFGNPGGRGARNAVTCRIHQDGTVESRNGAQDIGTGMKTVLAMLTAEELQLDVAKIRVTMGDTADPPGPGSGGSTTTPSLAPAARLAAGLAKQRLLELVAEHLGVAVERVSVEQGRWGVSGEKTLTFVDACKLIGPQPIDELGVRFENYEGYADTVFGCQFAEVEVDTQTGEVQVLELLAVQDCGVVINNKLAESQVIGAMIGGLSYTLHEQRLLDRKLGRMLNGDMLFYKIAGSRDMPRLRAIMFPIRNGMNNVGAAGLGEPPAIPTPAAIANAIGNAIGAPVRSMPITPDKVLAALAAARRNQTRNAGDNR